MNKEIEVFKKPFEGLKENKWTRYWVKMNEIINEKKVIKNE